MKYKVGDRVKIKDDFSCDKNYEVGSNKRMKKYADCLNSIED